MGCLVYYEERSTKYIRRDGTFCNGAGIRTCSSFVHAACRSRCEGGMQGLSSGGGQGLVNTYPEAPVAAQDALPGQLASRNGKRGAG